MRLMNPIAENGRRRAEIEIPKWNNSRSAAPFSKTKRRRNLEIPRRKLGQGALNNCRAPPEETRFFTEHYVFNATDIAKALRRVSVTLLANSQRRRKVNMNRLRQVPSIIATLRSRLGLRLGDRRAFIHLVERHSKLKRLFAELSPFCCDIVIYDVFVDKNTVRHR